MDIKNKNLGKVCITCEGDWDINKVYDKLCLVYDNLSEKTYISKINVPKGIGITNTFYWQKFSIGVNNGKQNVYHFNIDINNSLDYYINEGLYLELYNAIKGNNLITLGSNNEVISSYAKIKNDDSLYFVSQIQIIDDENNLKVNSYQITIDKNFHLKSIYKENNINESSINIIEIKDIDNLFN